MVGAVLFSSRSMRTNGHGGRIDNGARGRRLHMLGIIVRNGPRGGAQGASVDHHGRLYRCDRFDAPVLRRSPFLLWVMPSTIVAMAVDGAMQLHALPLLSPCQK